MGEQLDGLGEPRVRRQVGTERVPTQLADLARQTPIVVDDERAQVGVVAGGHPEHELGAEQRAVEARPQQLDRDVDALCRISVADLRRGHDAEIVVTEHNGVLRLLTC